MTMVGTKMPVFTLSATICEATCKEGVTVPVGLIVGLCVGITGLLLGLREGLKVVVGLNAGLRVGVAEKVNSNIRELLVSLTRILVCPVTTNPAELNIWSFKLLGFRD